jgi:hypothetical protein
MGKTHNWESDLVVTSSGYSYQVYNDFVNASTRKQRIQLPHLRKPNNQNFFSLVKTLIKGGVNGNELWQIPIPAAFCEPLSML